MVSVVRAGQLLFLIAFIALPLDASFAAGKKRKTAQNPTVTALPSSVANAAIARQFSVGSGQDQVGRLQTGEDTEQDGPQAIYAGRSGEILLLDQTNGRVLSFDGRDTASPTRSLSLPDGIEPTDMIATESGVVVWDGKPIALDVRGDGLTRSLAISRDMSAAVDEGTLSMFGQMGSQDTGNVDDAMAGATRSIKQDRDDEDRSGPVKKVVNTRGAGAVRLVISRDAAQTGVGIVVTSKASDAALAKLQLKAKDRLGAVELLEIDTLGRMYVLVEVVPSWHSGSAITFVARFAQNSDFEGIYQLPLAPDVALARRFVTVSTDGEVYFLRTRKGVVDVLGVGFKPLAKNTIITLSRPSQTLSRDAAAQSTSDGTRAPIAAVGPLTRQRVVNTAFGFEGINWRVTQASYGPDPDHQCDGFNRIRRPGYLIGKLNQVARGVPYCWGCNGSLAQFANRVSSGALAGNVCTRNDPRRDVVGVDCSSFVSAAWGLSTYFTTVAIPSIAERIDDPWSMRPGDALNKPGSHVMLFLGFTPDRKVQVMEASPGACNGRVCRNVYALGSLLGRGYVPRRFRALANDTATVDGQGQAPQQVTAQTVAKANRTTADEAVRPAKASQPKTVAKRSPSTNSAIWNDRR